MDQHQLGRRAGRFAKTIHFSPQRAKFLEFLLQQSLVRRDLVAGRWSVVRGPVLRRRQTRVCKQDAHA